MSVVDLLRRGSWSSVPADTIESLTSHGRVVEFPAGRTVYAEADAEGLAVVTVGLLRVYMHTGDGRQVTVRYVRAGDLLGVPTLIAGPAPVFVQAVARGNTPTTLKVTGQATTNASLTRRPLLAATIEDGKTVTEVQSAQIDFLPLKRPAFIGIPFQLSGSSHAGCSRSRWTVNPHGC